MRNPRGTPKARSPQEVAAAIRAAAQSHVAGALAGLISGYHPIDIAFAMRELSGEDRAAVFELLDAAASGVVLEEVDDEISEDLLEATDEGELAEIIDAMPPDVGADAVSLLPEDRQHRILNRIPDDEARELARLLEHSEDSAGGIMTSDVIAAPPDVTAQGVIQHIRRTDVHPEAMSRVYVVDDQRRLIGAVDIAALINARDDQPLQKIMEHDPLSVHPETDQEEVVQLVDKYDLPSLPVVDGHGRLLGAVTVDDVIDVLQQEATEDLAYVAGTSAEDLMTKSSLRSARARVPWLLISLAASFLSAAVIRAFSGTLEQAVVLAAFIPVITAMSGNSGLQSSTITVRSIALGMLKGVSLGAVVLRQVPVALVIATVCGVVAAGAGALILGDPSYGLIVGTAMFCAICVGTLLGSLVPCVFSRVGVDPAIASGPFVTTLNDALSLLIYFGIAAGLLQVLHS
jgi:magnesium transporter